MNTSRPLKKADEMPIESVKVLKSDVCSVSVVDRPRELVMLLRKPLASEAPRPIEPVRVLESDT